MSRPFAFRCGGYQPARSIHNRAARKLGEELAKTFGEACAFELTEDITTTGRRAVELLDMVERGDLDACYFSASYLAARAPSLGVFDLPFTIADRSDLYAKLDGALGANLSQAVSGMTGFQVLGFWDNGIRHVSNRVRPILHPRDCAGLSIRTLESSLHQATFHALGFTPKAIDVRDLRAAVAGHVVDAQENPLTNFITFALHESHPFISLTGHFFGIVLFLVNRARFDELPADVRAGIADCVAIATAAQRRYAIEEDVEGLEFLGARGIEVTLPEAIDREAFRSAVSGVVAEAEARLDPWLLCELRRT